MTNPSNYDSYDEYFDACFDEEVESGKDREQAIFDRQMYEANGEEWEGQYGGRPGY